VRAILILLASSALAAAAETTVIYDGAVTRTPDAVSEQDNLWLTLPDLTRSTRFVLKPQGACLDEFCVPIPKSKKDAYLRQQDRTQLFNVAELARTLHQAALHDVTNGVWLFGARPESQMKLVETLQAPDFTLPDWKGTPRSLSDFRGKKVLLVTWASW
jgi:hypothetical protein